jgi:hypothetical protein
MRSDAIRTKKVNLLNDPFGGVRAKLLRCAALRYIAWLAHLTDLRVISERQIQETRSFAAEFRTTSKETRGFIRC